MTEKKAPTLPSEIQLLPQEEIRERQFLLQRLQQFSLAFNLILILILISGLFFLYWKKQVIQEWNFFNEQLSQNLQQLNAYEGTITEFKILEQKLDWLSLLRQNKEPESQILELLEKTIPPGVILTEIQDKDKLYLRGETQDYQSLISFRRALEGEDQTKKVQLNQIRREDAASPIFFELGVILGKTNQNEKQ